MRYPKKYTVKEWKRFSWDMQEKLCNKYIVILTDHKTKKEKAKILMQKLNMKNFNTGMAVFNSGVRQFTNTIDQVTKPIGKKQSVNIWPVQKTPKKRRKTKIEKARQKQNYDFIVGSRKKIWR
jgi:hypothetical protein